MFVPLELSMLANRKGYLSPELTVGWRIGKHAEELFGGLVDVRIATTLPADAVVALRHLASRTGREVTEVPVLRPWDALFYHTPTHTALKIVLTERLVTLPPPIRALEDCFGPQETPAVLCYRAGLANLVTRLLTAKISGFCQLRMIRCWPLPRLARQPERCGWCGRPMGEENFWDIDGTVHCPRCAGLEPEWLTRGAPARQDENHHIAVSGEKRCERQ